MAFSLKHIHKAYKKVSIPFPVKTVLGEWGNTQAAQLEKKKKRKQKSKWWVYRKYTEEEQIIVSVYRPPVSLLKMPGEMGLGRV